MVWGVLPQKGLRHSVVDILTSDTPDVLDLFNLKGLTAIFNPILGCLSLEGATHLCSDNSLRFWVESWGHLMRSEAYSLDKQHVPFLSDVQNLVEGTSLGNLSQCGFCSHRAAGPCSPNGFHKSLLETVSPPLRQTLSSELSSPRWYP
jgi:hypothetical protein